MPPPTPGPLAMAATLVIDFGAMILVGAFIGIPMERLGGRHRLCGDSDRGFGGAVAIAPRLIADF
ncbi:MAG: hypothetical protein FJW20_08475 [Acidimicrobiia bacterium]|nr:hypothetical protein [Acidimicrobiia bacterium]